MAAATNRNAPILTSPTVDAAMQDPTLLLQAAANADPGWADPYGGPEGIAVLAGEIRDQLDDQARTFAALRAAAVAELLRDQSLAAVGRQLGISKTAVHKINGEVAKRPHPYAHLLVEGRW